MFNFTLRRLILRRPRQIDIFESGQVILCAVLFAPIIALMLLAWGDGEGIITHLIATVLGGYFFNTFVLMIGVGALALVFGVASAWAVSRYDFPFRASIEWMLVLPAAVPSYIVAYSYTDFLDYAGTVQTSLRLVFGFGDARDYWFPEIRSMGGAMLVMGAVLYPYVYITTRTAFRLTSTRLFEAARMAGGNMLTIALPLARPAIAAGLALVMMEVISDFGTVEYFAIDTLTLGIFNVWLGMGNIVVAAQIALMALALIFILLGLEYWADSKRRTNSSSFSRAGVPKIKLHGMAALGMVGLCFVPITLGFILPVGVLLSFIAPSLAAGIDNATWAAITNSLIIAGITSCIIMAMAMAIGIIAHYRARSFGRILAAVSAFGYAVPGVILAIGVLGCVGAVDGAWRYVMDNNTGLLSGSLAVLIFAYVVRFQAAGYGTVRAGLKRLPPSLMPAGQVMGRRFAANVGYVILPLMRPSLMAGLLVVFVDVMKELPMTLLLSPFNTKTLATLTYQFAKNEMLDEAALPALLIVLAGLLPVMIINRSLSVKGRE